MATLEEQIEALEQILNASEAGYTPKMSSKVAMVKMAAEDMTDEEKKEAKKSLREFELNITFGYRISLPRSTSWRHRRREF